MQNGERYTLVVREDPKTAAAAAAASAAAAARKRALRGEQDKAASLAKSKVMRMFVSQKCHSHTCFIYGGMLIRITHSRYVHACVNVCTRFDATLREDRSTTLLNNSRTSKLKIGQDTAVRNSERSKKHATLKIVSFPDA